MMLLRYAFVFLFIAAYGCKSKSAEPKDEHIRVDQQLPVDAPDTSHNNVIQGNLSLAQLQSYPNNVVLTGMADHRIVTIYKDRKPEQRKLDDYYSSNDYSYGAGLDEFEDDRYSHFMPGIDLLYGYNLLNLAHYDLKQEKLNFLFDRPVLVKSLYYPSFVPDSVDKKPINRDYFLVSVYDTDSNKDSVINRHDLRKFYYFNSSCTEKIQLIPKEYSVVRSEYDRANDVMYVFSKHDANNNGTPEKKEPIHIFWIDLKVPTQAKRLY